MSAFADVKDELHEIAFVTSIVSEPKFLPLLQSCQYLNPVFFVDPVVELLLSLLVIG